MTRNETSAQEMDREKKEEMKSSGYRNDKMTYRNTSVTVSLSEAK